MRLEAWGLGLGAWGLRLEGVWAFVWGGFGVSGLPVLGV